jgi:diaminopimelate epimerase
MEKSQFRFKTGAGLVTTEALGDGKIRVKMPEAKFLQKEISLKTKSSSVEKFALVNTGVPHLVQKIHDMLDVTSLKDMAREARSHHDLQPAGANVTFFAEHSARTIKAVTFERGVEDYTLACGTGAVAAALVHSASSGEMNVEVQMPGGTLQVLLLEDDPHPLMTGEAVFIGEFKYNLEVIK